MQWESTAQVARHVLPPQLYPPHDLGTSLQLPAALHVLAWVSMPMLQTLEPHGLLEPGNLQLVVVTPSHAWPHAVPAPVPPHAARVPCGAPSTGVHVPTEPGTSHAWHCDPHAPSQQ
jgi:hypothetical protein